MAKQWVDITTIDNVTPFTKVRWKSVMTYAGNDTWLAEAPGLNTAGMDWSDGNTAALGYFGGHRMNHNADWGNAYTCSMNCEQYGIDQRTIAYRVAVKDESRGRAGFYDSAVTMSGETYYEVDFSLWENASGKSLYMPYAVAPWAPGDILVEIESSPIKLDKDSMSFEATGGSQTVIVTADDDWTASASDGWITVSVLSGASGTSSVTISTPNYIVTTTGRTGSVTFTCSGDTAVLSVSQKKASSVGGIFIGADAAEAIYIGNTEVSAMYIGENKVFPATSLPSVPFLVNYNAKRFSNGSIPQESGALVASALTVLNVTSHSDYLSFNDTAETVFDFGSDANNPFNITPSDLGLTIIAKTGRGVTTSGNLISNRGLSGTSKLNWMYRPAKSDDTLTFHTLDGSWDGNGYTLSAYPNIYAFRINPSDSNNGQYNSYTDGTSAATGQVSCQSTQSDKVVFFNGYPSSQTEHFTGDFYWIYVARTYLTDAEVQQVINYNENYI